MVILFCNPDLFKILMFYIPSSKDTKQAVLNWLLKQSK